jgi:hypothetical protein
MMNLKLSNNKNVFNNDTMLLPLTSNPFKLNLQCAPSDYSHTNPMLIHYQNHKLQNKYSKLNSIHFKKTPEVKIYKSPLKVKKSGRSSYSMSSSRKTTKRMYNLSSYESDRSNDGESSSYTSYANTEEKKMPVLIRYKDYKSNKSKGDTKSIADLFYENQKNFRDILRRYGKEEGKKIKAMKKSIKNKRIYRSESKQKIVLKIPTMISVTVDNMNLRIRDESDSESGDWGAGYKRKRKTKLQSIRGSKNISKTCIISSKPYKETRSYQSRKELKILESKTSENIILPKQLIKKPIFKNVGYKKKKYKRSIIEHASDQFKNSKELRTNNSCKIDAKAMDLEKSRNETININGREQ